jgi:transcriptional regulator with XRE-family HTH domain
MPRKKVLRKKSADQAFSLPEQFDILIEYGKQRGIPVTYRAIAEGSGESLNNVYRLHHGQNLNPGVTTLSAIAEYFQTDLGFFNCKIREEALAYLDKTVPEKTFEAVALRTKDISASGMKKIMELIDLIRLAEGLPPGDKK